jgi:hypothetical protein
LFATERIFFQLPIHIQHCNELEIGLISAMASHRSRMAAAAAVLLSAMNRFITVLSICHTKTKSSLDHMVDVSMALSGWWVTR